MYQLTGCRTHPPTPATVTAIDIGAGMTDVISCVAPDVSQS